MHTKKKRAVSKKRIKDDPWKEIKLILGQLQQYLAQGPAYKYPGQWPRGRELLNEGIRVCERAIERNCKVEEFQVVRVHLLYLLQLGPPPFKPSNGMRLEAFYFLKIKTFEYLNLLD